MGELKGTLNNENIAFLIQARTGSKRLPGKVLLPFDGTNSVLKIIVANLKQAFPKIKLVVCTSLLNVDDPIADFCETNNVLVFRGDAENVLSRLIEAAKKNKISWIFRICADNPFLNMDYILEILQKHRKDNSFDYYSFFTSEGTPVIKTHYGLFGELVSLEALEQVATATSVPLYLEHVTNYIYSQDQFRLFRIKLPQMLESRPYLRFTMDDAEDFNLLQRLYGYYSDFNFNLEKLIAFIDKQPEIKQSMLNRILKYSK